MSRFVAHMGGWGDKPWASASEVMEVAAIMTKSRGLCIVLASYSVALQVLNALHQLAGQTDRGHTVPATASRTAIATAKEAAVVAVLPGLRSL